LSKKTVSILIVICFSIISINQCLADSGYRSDTSVYGFIVSSVKLEDFSLENQINCKINHMINDLLREQLPVYWTATNGTASIKEIRSDKEDEMFFDKGTFIIPFTGNLTDDKKIIAIIYDYNQSSELEEDDTIKIPIFLLMESLNIEAHLLSEVKIVQVVNKMTSGEEHWYLEIAEECGFLTFDQIEDKDLGKKLNNVDYNVVMWPGGAPGQLGVYIPNSLRAELRRDSASGSIRKFVCNGGGYIGSCYGAYVASSAYLPLPIYFRRRVYNPNLRSFMLLAISDSITIGTSLIKDVQIRIVDNSHPVTYGLDPIIINLYYHGPKFLYIGKNSQAIALFQNSSKTLDGTPSWVSSKFGEGRTVLFSPHPEMYAVDLEMRNTPPTW